jgi:hypothetical protein
MWKFIDNYVETISFNDYFDENQTKDYMDK